MSSIYETTATHVGGRKGTVQTENKAIDLQITPPDNTDTDSTNPVQLFAAGYASCFSSALDIILKRNKFLKAEPVVDLTVLLVDDPGSESPKLEVVIHAKVKNISQEDAETSLQQANDYCPYSKAVDGNIDVTLNIEVVA
ncbi:peroxiredoxin [Staphylococcus microti]|uniref:Organic hydroperoxide resistance protein n=1 Tax=Staphylococcus microti TaxID=569857 RepID=A0A0D6XPE7_9STAP|nr:Ohr family peroxiredoxin [Staphylococcus microti]KIX90305.1 peroxiredoxin [Staphylococcus microti]PNZ83967.1 peroxiredoxin [Staphylococcus microti]SUM56877.1 organic hydroperoxide resistance protein [Staphylococcus microti]